MLHSVNKLWYPLHSHRFCLQLSAVMNATPPGPVLQFLESTGGVVEDIDRDFVGKVDLTELFRVSYLSFSLPSFLEHPLES